MPPNELNRSVPEFVTNDLSDLASQHVTPYPMTFEDRLDRLAIIGARQVLLMSTLLDLASTMDDERQVPIDQSP